MWRIYSNPDPHGAQTKDLTIRNTHVKYETCIYQAKIMTKVKVFESRSNSKVKGQRVKTMVLNERYYHKEYTSEI